MEKSWEACNILQYELWVEDSAPRSLTEAVTESTSDSVLLELESKTLTTNKLVVRIFDVEGKVTELAHHIKLLEHKRERHFNAKRSNLLSNGYAWWQIARLNQRIDKVQREILDYFVDYLCTAYPDVWEVVIETQEHTFRSPTRGEFLTLLAAAKRASRLWLFVFEPNELLADRNRLIVSVM